MGRGVPTDDGASPRMLPITGYAIDRQLGIDGRRTNAAVTVAI
jgi:hypothetical protein